LYSWFDVADGLVSVRVTDRRPVGRFGLVERINSSAFAIC